MKPQSLISITAICSLLVLFCACGNGDDESGDLSSESAQTGVQSESSFPSDSQLANKNVEEAVLVTVDGKSLTRSMATNMVQEIAARRGVPPQMMSQFLAQMGEQLEQQAVEEFVNQSLLEKEVARLEIPVSDQEIDAVVADLTKTLPQGVTLEQALVSQNIEMTEFRTSVASNERVRKLYNSKTASAEPATKAQVEAYYQENIEQFTTGETVTASHILIGCDDTEDAAVHSKARSEATAVLAQLEQGADFGELALTKSSCPSKENGGSLGSFTRGQMVPEFEDAAFGQEIGKVGPVVKTKFGYHLIKVTGRTEGGVRSLDSVSGDIEEHLETVARERIFGAFVDTLREQAEITYAAGLGS